MRLPSLTVSISFSLLCLPLSSKPSDKPFSTWLDGPWKVLHIGYLVDDGCTGGSIRNRFTILRKGTEMRLLGSRITADGNPLPARSRPLNSTEFEQIKKELLSHLKIAETEIDLNEYFASMPEEERKTKLEAHFKKHGRPHGGFGGRYFYVKFGEGEFSQTFTNAFEANHSCTSYSKWISNTAALAAKP